MSTTISMLSTVQDLYLGHNNTTDGLGTESVSGDTNATFLTTAAPKSSSVDISTKVSYVTVPVFGVLGLTGNILTIIIMRSKYFRMSTTGVFLTALALSDTTFILISPFTKTFVKDIFRQDPKALTEAGCKAFFFIFRSAKICSSWYVVIICLERFLVIWFPLQAKVICRRQIAVVFVTIITGCIFIFDGVWTITTDIVNGNCIPNVVTPSTQDVAAAFVIAGTAIFNIIPTCVLLLFTPMSIFKLFRQVSFRRQISTTDRNEDAYRVTRMLLAVIIAYIVLVTPISVAHSVAFFNGENIFTSKSPDFVIFREVAQTFEQLNYSLNFILYLSCNATFRRHFYVIIGFQKNEMRSAMGWQPPTQPPVSSRQTSPNSTESSTVNHSYD